MLIIAHLSAIFKSTIDSSYNHNFTEEINKQRGLRTCSYFCAELSRKLVNLLIDAKVCTLLFQIIFVATLSLCFHAIVHTLCFIKKSASSDVHSVLLCRNLFQIPYSSQSLSYFWCYYGLFCKYVGVVKKPDLDYPTTTLEALGTFE